MQITTQPECPEYFRFSKSNCTCVLRPEHMDKIGQLQHNQKKNIEEKKEAYSCPVRHRLSSRSNKKKEEMPKGDVL